MSTVDEVRWTSVSEDVIDLPLVGVIVDNLDDALLDEQRRRADVVRLAGRFVERVIGDALDARQRLHPEAPAPEVDWEALWATGARCASVEQAVGRVVVAAESLARNIARGTAPPRTHQTRARLSRPAPAIEAGPAEIVVPAWSPPHVARTPPPADLPTFVWGPGDVSAEPLQAGLVPGGYTLDVSDLDTLGLRPGTEEHGPVQPVALRPDQIRTIRRQRLATVFAWVRNAGVALILFAVWQVWGTSLSQHQAQDSLHQQFTAHVRATPPKSTTSTTPAGPTLVAAAVRLPEPAEGSAVAHLRIPAIGVDQYVVEGTAEGDLQKGPGHYIGTAMPGQAGNVAIAGHRTTYGAPFNNLNELAPGDEVDLTTLSGENLDYVVTQPPVPVAPSDVKILNSFGDNRLTLTTCNPRYSATQRLVVVALLREPAGAGVQTSPTPAVQARAKPRAVPNGGSVGWNLTYLPGVLAVLVFIVLLGLGNRRAATYYGRRGRWLILVPIWLAATYVLFGLLSNLVPATL